MIRAHWSTRLPQSACAEAVAWARTQPSAAVAWRTCTRSDWMLWLLARTCATGSARHRRVVLAACDCAATALRHVPAGERRPAECLRVVRAWARGRATIDQVREARTAASAYAASDASDAAAADAADAAASDAAASDASDAAAYAAAASDASDAAASDAAASAASDAAASAAAADAADAARTRSLARSARIVRRHFPCPPRLP